MSRKNRGKKGGGSGPAVSGQHAVLPTVREKLASLREDPEQGPLWGEIHRLLLKAKADARATARAITSRDPDLVDAIVTSLETGTEVETTSSNEPVAGISPDELKKAMHAFRKRLKLTRLDHESKLGVGPMSSGRTADVDAILPPREFPEEVWRALVAEGKLKDAGQGFFALAD